jgi:hypothetical protein
LQKALPPPYDRAFPVRLPPPNMCTKVVHKYGCGHEIAEKAPCATSRTAPCGVCNTKTVKHDEKCDRCDH